MREIEERERKGGGSRGKGRRREVNRKESWQREEGNTQGDRSGKEEWRREEGDRRGWERGETIYFKSLVTGNNYLSA